MNTSLDLTDKDADNGLSLALRGSLLCERSLADQVKKFWWYSDASGVGHILQV